MKRLSRKKRLLPMLRKLVSGDHCPVRLPWFLCYSDSEPMNALHRLAFQAEWLLNPPAKRTLLALRGALWPVVSAVQIVKALRRHGGPVRSQRGVGLGRQILEMAILANFHNLTPEHYYKFALYLPERWAQRGRYLNQGESEMLLRFLNAGRDTLELNDKTRFHARCERTGLPSAGLIASFEQGEVAQWRAGAPGAWPRADVFIKAARLNSGAGAECWRYCAGSNRWRNGSLVKDAGGLLEHAKARSRDAQCLAETRLVNHPALACFSSTGLCSIRLATHYCPPDPVRPLYACVLLPRAGSPVSNLGAGGLEAAVDLETGVLSTALDRTFARGIRVHPDTAAPIEGFSLPLWNDVLELARRAHMHSPEAFFIGWDIGLTPAGPVLIESNTIFGVAAQDEEWLVRDDAFARMYFRSLAAKLAEVQQ